MKASTPTHLKHTLERHVKRERSGAEKKERSTDDHKEHLYVRFARVTATSDTKQKCRKSERDAAKRRSLNEKSDKEERAYRNLNRNVPVSDNLDANSGGR